MFLDEGAPYHRWAAFGMGDIELWSATGLTSISERNDNWFVKQ